MVARTSSMARTKYCSSCEQTRSISSFGRNRQAKDGLHYYCKECAAVRQRAWAKSNPTKVKAMRDSYLDRMRELNADRNPYE